MSHYFFTIAALPPLYVGIRPEISFESFMQLLEENFSSADMKKVNALREYIDVLNVKKLLKNQPIDVRGNYTEKQLGDALVELLDLPPVVIEYLEKYEAEEERKKHFSELIAEYLRSKAESTSGFAHSFYIFEWQLRIALTAFRCVKLKRDVVQELSFEDPRDPFIAELLVQKDATYFEFPYELQHLNDAFHHVKTPLDQFRAIIESQFFFAAEYAERVGFSLDYVLAYMMQLIAVENWSTLSEEQGIGIIEGMV